MGALPPANGMQVGRIFFSSMLLMIICESSQWSCSGQKILQRQLRNAYGKRPYLYLNLSSYYYRKKILSLAYFGHFELDELHRRSTSPLELIKV